LFSGLFASSYAAREVIDRIVAIVGNRVILASELASQIQLQAFQTGRQPKTKEELQQMQNEVLEQMISDQLFLMAAQEDTSITVRPEEVEQALDDHIARVAQGFESNEKFLEALAAEELTIRDLKKQYRSEIENQILKQRFIQKKLSSISVSRREVEDFYKKYKDSIPGQPEAVKLAHILIPIEPSQRVEDSVKELAMELRRRVLEGADFAAISAQYSSMGAGANGGDLGYVSREDVVPEFARAAFKLSVGDISGVIRTQFGYHIIKCEGKKGDRLKLRHNLLAVEPSGEDTMRAIRLADSLLQEARNGADFAQLAKMFSADNETRAQGGELGWFATEQLPAEFAAEVSGWKTPGEYKGPIQSQFGLHILKLLDYQPARQFTLKDDYDRIKEMARQQKAAKVIEEWISKIKKKTYIEYRLADASR
jgi:peptidyl-prolyl cis-trans isomerase SurA